MTNHIPTGYQAVTPYLMPENGIKALGFYPRAFDTEERVRLIAPGGTLGHAEMVSDGCAILLADECPETHMRDPTSIGGSSVGVHLYIKNIAAFVDRTVAAGAMLMNARELAMGHFWY